MEKISEDRNQISPIISSINSSTSFRSEVFSSHVSSSAFPTTNSQSCSSDEINKWSSCAEFFPPNKSLSRLCLGGEIVQIPSAILTSGDVFRKAISMDAYTSLTNESQEYLKRFLPKFKYNEVDPDRLLNAVFTDDPNFFFGNPIEKIYAKIKSNYFNSERPSDLVLMRDNLRVQYEQNIRKYMLKTVKEIHIARHRLVKHFAKLGPYNNIHFPLPPNRFSRKRKIEQDEIQKRAIHRIKLLLNHVKAEVNDNRQSSDEEFDTDEEEELLFKHKKLSTNVPVVSVGHSTLYSPHFPDLDLHQPIRLEKLKDLVKRYKRLKKKSPNSTLLDFTGITLEDVYTRAGLACNAEKNLPVEITEAMKQPITPPR